MMGLNWQVLCLAAIFAIGVVADNNALINCIHGKYKADLGSNYETCYNRSRALRPERVKSCYQEEMKIADVVVTKDRQMTVDRQKFGEYAQTHSNNNIGKAMKECYDSTTATDDMYKEAARASQCVFEKVKATCRN
ncbi:hypothetical protein X975_08483, partial [Stegodyphus mimosarum]